MKTARNGSYVLYKNKEYYGDRLYNQSKFKLLSFDSEDLQLGFREVSAGKYVKEVHSDEIQSSYSITSYALYRRLQFQVINIDGDTILLYHSGPSLEREELGFRMVDRFEYEKEVHRSELEKMWEERTPLWGFQLPNKPDDNQ